MSLGILNHAYPVICTQCGFHVWVERRDGKVYAKHPATARCGNSEKAWEIVEEFVNVPILREVDKDILNNAEGIPPC